MGLFDIGSILKAGAEIADEFVTTEEEKLQYQIEKEKLRLQEKQIEANLLEKVHETNIEEAKSKNLFIAGWRPFIGWIGGVALAYHFILAPFLYSFFKAFSINFELPTLDIGVLLNLILTMLGIAGLRTFEKLKGVSHKHD